MTIINQSILQGNKENPVGRGLCDDANAHQNHHEIVKVIIPKQFENDVRALCDHAGVDELTPGTTIRMTLQEILEIIPKERKRKDSYKILADFLKNEMNITLELTSRKNKTVKAWHTTDVKI